jgi:hypothetical protein
MNLAKGVKQMKTSDFSRCALSFCAAGTLFAACGGPTQGWSAPPPLQLSTKVSRESLKRAAGGSFTASYAGKFRGLCGFPHVRDEYFRGTGSGTFIGRSGMKGPLYCQGRTGNFIFRSKEHRAETFSVTVNNGSYTVTGGTGKFANASGNGTFSISKKGLTFTSSWTGTLNF